MFNFIMSTGLQNRTHGSILKNRVFERTDQYLVDRFTINGQIDFDQLNKIPSVFLQEGMGNEPVGIGRFSNVRRQGNSYEFDIHLEHNLPLLTNAEFFDICESWDFSQYSFSRNYWQVVDEDLFAGLYRAQISRPAQPSAFRLSENPVQNDLIAFMMPFDRAFRGVYDRLKNDLETNGFKVRRADDFWQHHNIIDDIIELICTARVVVCDLSTKNPNVFYEAGIAYTLGKDVILITNNNDDVPFDLRSIRYIHYLNNEQGVGELSQALMERVGTLIR